VDEAQVSPATTVAELERLVEAGRQAGRQEAPFVSWPLGLPAAIGRELFIQGLVFPLYHAFWRVRVVGQERLADLNEPVMIASNHNFGAGTIGLEPAAIGMALPRRLRLRVCMAGEEHAVFDPRFKGFMARLCNVFPLSKEGNVRGSLEYIGRLLDLGWSIVIFPEGKLTAGGPMQPFMGGTGLMAVEGHTPVVPVKITVERDSALQGHWWPPRGAFTVELGEPIRFEPGTTYAEATQRIEAAVRALG
jgi:long-chain acyl-CoA synthetase